MPSKSDLSKDLAHHLGELVTGQKQARAAKTVGSKMVEWATSDMKNQDFKEFLFLTEMLSSAIHVNGDVSDEQRSELGEYIGKWKKKSGIRSRMTDQQFNKLSAVLEQGYIPFQEIISAFNANSSSYDQRKTEALREYLYNIINSNNRQDIVERIYVLRINLLLQGRSDLSLFYVYDNEPLVGHASDLVTMVAKDEVGTQFPATSVDLKVNELATLSPGNDRSLISLDELTTADLEESFESELVEALRLGGAKRVLIRTMQSTQEDKSKEQKIKGSGRMGFLTGKKSVDANLESSGTSSTEDEREYTFEDSSSAWAKMFRGKEDKLTEYVDNSKWLKNDPEVRNMVMARSSSNKDNALTSYQYSGTINKTAQLALDVDMALSASKGKVAKVQGTSETRTKLEVQSEIKREIQVKF